MTVKRNRYRLSDTSLSNAAHFGISLAIIAVNSSGVLATGTKPASSKRYCTASDFNV